jgi:lipoyl(octanoyl) transferase
MADPRPDPEWLISPAPLDYAEALAAMEARAEAVARGEARELVWLLEHPAVITAGTSAAAPELLDATRFPVFRAGRGGRYTYHGPGQRVVYTILDLGARGRDVRRLVASLEQWAIGALADLGIEAFTSPAGTGIWVDRPAGAGSAASQAKIGAIGVRVRRWVSFHGMALNVTTDLDHYRAIVPCGLEGHGVTRAADLAAGASLAALDRALERQFPAFLHRLAAAPQGAHQDA